MALSSANSTELTAEQVQKVLVQPLAQRSVFLSMPGSRSSTPPGRCACPRVRRPTTPTGTARTSRSPRRTPPSTRSRSSPHDEVGQDPDPLLQRARPAVRVALDAALRNRLVTDVAAKVDGQLLSATGDGVAIPRVSSRYAGQTLAVGGALSLDHMIDADALALVPT